MIRTKGKTTTPRTLEEDEEFSTLVRESHRREIVLRKFPDARCILETVTARPPIWRIFSDEADQFLSKRCSSMDEAWNSAWELTRITWYRRLGHTLLFLVCLPDKSFPKSDEQTGPAWGARLFLFLLILLPMFCDVDGKTPWEVWVLWEIFVIFIFSGKFT